MDTVQRLPKTSKELQNAVYDDFKRAVRLGSNFFGIASNLYGKQSHNVALVQVITLTAMFLVIFVQIHIYLVQTCCYALISHLSAWYTPCYAT